MSASTEEFSGYIARENIRDCIARLARGEDRRNAEQITACYWPDSITDYGVFRGDFAEYLAWVVPGSPAIPCTQHFVGQSVIEVEGERARAETQVISYHRVDMGAEHRDVVIGGRYLDVFARRNGEWRIAERTMLYDWTQDFGVAADWSQGIMGMAFSGPHFTGRAVSDYSETFFAQGSR